MKKVLYIFAVAFVAITACTKEIEGPSAEQNDPVIVEDGPMATLSFTATFPDTQIPTRALSDEAVIENIYVAVFGLSSNVNGGTLLHWAPAQLTKVDDATHTYTATYKVTLPLSHEGRVVVFVANYTSDTPPLFERENQVLAGLYTERYKDNGDETNGAYWQRVVLNDGIVGVDNGDGTYQLDNVTLGLLSNIHLVRNFAKVTLEAPAEGAEFTISDYNIINVPTRGSVAPMIIDHGNKSFNTRYTSIASYCDPAQGFTHNFFDDLMSDKYLGFMPEGAEIDTDDPGWEATKKTPGNGFYMFERTVPTQAHTQTAVICKLTWKSKAWFDANNKQNSPNYQYAGNTYFYKVELMGSSGEYIPICRNIWYKINVNGIEGDGEQDYEHAFTGPFFGNVSASIETATLNEITDNISTLKVNMMEWTEINDNQVVDVYFNYEPEADQPAANTAGFDGSTDVTVTLREASGFDPSIASQSNITIADSPTSGTYRGWGHLKVQLGTKPNNGMRRSIVRVQGNRDGKRVIFRDIVFTLMSDAEFSTTSSDITTSGNNVTVNVKIPAELGYSVFPIQVKIEAKNNNLTTTNSNLPVKFGTSAFDSDKNSFYFVRTIQYSEYYSKNASGEWVYKTEYPCILQKTDNQAVIVKLSADYFKTTNELTAQ